MDLRFTRGETPIVPFVHKVFRAIREIRRDTQCTQPQAEQKVLELLEMDNDGKVNASSEIKACLQCLIVGPGFSQYYYDAALRHYYYSYKPSGPYSSLKTWRKAFLELKDMYSLMSEVEFAVDWDISACTQLLFFVSEIPGCQELTLTLRDKLEAASRSGTFETELWLEKIQAHFIDALERTERRIPEEQESLKDVATQLTQRFADLSSDISDKRFARRVPPTFLRETTSEKWFRPAPPKSSM